MVKSIWGNSLRMTSKGFKPKLQTLDNEASAALKSFSTENDVEFQLVPPHCHRRNATERAIRTFKEHFVAGLKSAYPDFPFHLWDPLLPQAEMTLNLLQTSWQHPQVSAAAHFHGMIDYKKKLLLCQDAISLHIKNRHNDELGHVMDNMATHWSMLCITTYVKMFTFPQRLAK
jgi:hypothetical protein